jgi:hypothetical protein
MALEAWMNPAQMVIVLYLRWIRLHLRVEQIFCAGDRRTLGRRRGRAFAQPLVKLSLARLHAISPTAASHSRNRALVGQPVPRNSTSHYWRYVCTMLPTRTAASLLAFSHVVQR